MTMQLKNRHYSAKKAKKVEIRIVLPIIASYEMDTKSLFETFFSMALVQSLIVLVSPKRNLIIFHYTMPGNIAKIAQAQC